MMRYSVTTTLDPARSQLTAQAVLHLDGETPFGEIALQLNPNLRVTSARVHGAACDFSRGESGRVVISWPANRASAEPVLEVDYAGCLPQHHAAGEEARAFIGEEFFWLRDDQLWFPVLADRQEELLPVSPGRYAVQMQMPAGWEAAASAPLLRRWQEGPRETYAWDNQDDYPGMCIVGGRLQRHVAGRCTFLWHTPRPDLAEIVLGALDFCEALLGPYPHAHLTVVLGPAFTPGGYADRGLIHVGENKLNARTLAHELVHQWWGRGVWAKRHGDRWLTEGLAGYLSLLYVAARGELQLGEILDEFREAYRRAVATWGDKPLAQVSSADYERKGLVSALLYKKGAWLHWLLHTRLGENYFRALRAICSDYCSKPISTEQYLASLAASCPEYRAAIETFAQQWIYAPGLPDAALEPSEIERVVL